MLVCMYVCMYVWDGWCCCFKGVSCMYVVCMHACIHVRTMYVCVYSVTMYSCTHLSGFMCRSMAWVRLCVHVCMYACKYMCVRACMRASKSDSFMTLEGRLHATK
jgi:hypothetical protein